MRYEEEYISRLLSVFRANLGAFKACTKIDSVLEVLKLLIHIPNGAIKLPTDLTGTNIELKKKNTNFLQPSRVRQRQVGEGPLPFHVVPRSSDVVVP